MECIASWSNVEASMMQIFVELAGGSAAAATAIYLAFENASAKTTVIETLARRNLPTDERSILTAMLKIAKSQQSERDKLAHWLWGYSEELPDALILVDPRELAKHRETQEALISLRSKYYVYTESDFSKQKAANDRLRGYAQTLLFILRDFPAGRKVEQVAALLAEPEVASMARRQVRPG